MGLSNLNCRNGFSYFSIIPKAYNFNLIPSSERKNSFKIPHSFIQTEAKKRVKSYNSNLSFTNYLKLRNNGVILKTKFSETKRYLGFEVKIKLYQRIRINIKKKGDFAVLEINDYAKLKKDVKIDDPVKNLTKIVAGKIYEKAERFIESYIDNNIFSFKFEENLNLGYRISEVKVLNNESFLIRINDEYI